MTNITEKETNGSTQRFPLRIVPWFTDGCSTFLANLFKWMPNVFSKKLSVLEFGGGNSTFFFLSKGLNVITIESDNGYIQSLYEIAQAMGFSVQKYNNLNDFMASDLKLDISIIFAENDKDIFEVMEKIETDIIVNDGIFRREVLERIVALKPNSVVVLDNVEYAANWGRLDRSSGKPDLIKAYRSFLRSTDWKSYIFEQNEGREGRGSSDKTGWESPHRWMSAVCWPNGHALTDLMISNLGFPVVNRFGLEDFDTESLGERCPFDWDKKEWVCGPFPKELDLKLNRDFD